MSFQIDLLLPLIVFCVVTLYTPGPNNMMLMTAGLNFGLRKSLPLVFGVALGFGFLVFCVAFGLGVLFTTYPIAYVVLKYLGAIYLLYLAWMIARADPAVLKAPSKKKRPMNFFEAAAFQWVNPKGWVMAVGAVSTYAALAAYPYNALLIAGLFGGLGITSSLAWAGFGTALQNLLKHPRAVRAVNIIMALLLVASLYPVFAE